MALTSTHNKTAEIKTILGSDVFAITLTVTPE